MSLNQNDIVSSKGSNKLVIDANVEHSSGPYQPDNSAFKEARFFEMASMDHQLKARKQELGKFGYYFGSGQSAATNIAGIVCLFCCLALGATILMNVNEVNTVRGTLSSILTGALGFVFGSKATDDKEKK